MTHAVLASIETMVRAAPVVLFMKGTRLFPRCGFSAVVVEALERLGADSVTHDVLADRELRQGIKQYSDWPTIPQLYVNGDFVGGADIVREMYESGELEVLLRSGERDGEAA